MRKIGSLYYDSNQKLDGSQLKEVHCVNVKHGRKLSQSKMSVDAAELKPHAVSLLIEDIVNIHSGLELYFSVYKTVCKKITNRLELSPLIISSQK